MLRRFMCSSRFIVQCARPVDVRTRRMQIEFCRSGDGLCPPTASLLPIKSRTVSSARPVLKAANTEDTGSAPLYGRAAMACCCPALRFARAALHRPQSSSASRFTAAQAGFFILSNRVSGLNGSAIPCACWGCLPEPHLAAVAKYDRAIALHVLVEPDAGAGLGSDAGAPPAHLEAGRGADRHRSAQSGPSNVTL